MFRLCSGARHVLGHSEWMRRGSSSGCRGQVPSEDGRTVSTGAGGLVARFRTFPPPLARASCQQTGLVARAPDVCQVARMGWPRHRRVRGDAPVPPTWCSREHVYSKSANPHRSAGPLAVMGRSFSPCRRACLSDEVRSAQGRPSLCPQVAIADGGVH